MIVKTVVSVVAYLILAPFAGCFLMGLGRKILAKSQGKKASQLMQPLYDVRKLFEKNSGEDKYIHDYYIKVSLFFTVISGVVFFAGGDILFVILSFFAADVFGIAAVYTSNLKYAQSGAENRFINILTASPMLILAALGFYMYCGSVNVRDILMTSFIPVLPLIGIFACCIVLIVIRLKQADLNLKVPGFSGKTLAYTQIARWYETVLAASLIFLFFGNGRMWGYLLGAVAAVIVYLAAVLIAGSTANMKWKSVLKAVWILTLVLGAINIFMLYVTM